MSLDLASSLSNKGGKVRALDPAIKNQIPHYSFIKICSSPKTFFKNLDLIILMTEWNEFLHLDLSNLSPLMKNRVIVDAKKLNIFDVRCLQ